MISSLLHESEAKPRTSVNNKDIIRMYLGYNLLISQRSIPISTSFYNEHINTMASTGCVTYQSFLCAVAYNRLSVAFIFMAFFLG